MAPVKKLVTESAHAGARLGPLAKSEVVELPLEAGELAMLEVLWKDLALESGDVEDLEMGPVHRPRENARVFVLQDIVESSHESRNLVDDILAGAHDGSVLLVWRC